MGTLAVRLEVPVIKASKGLTPSSHFPVGFRLTVAGHAGHASGSLVGELTLEQDHLGLLIGTQGFGVQFLPSLLKTNQPWLEPRVGIAPGHARMVGGPPGPATAICRPGGCAPADTPLQQMAS